MSFFQDARISDQGHADHRASVVWTRIQSAVARTLAHRAERRRRARELDTLRNFSDRELWDIGLGRSDVIGVVNGTYHRE
jgi:uncharacterized protein YjiS (DUF1127 family)